MKKQILVALGISAVVIIIFAGIKFLQISAAIAAGKARQAPPVAVTSIVAEVEEWPMTLHAVATLAAVKGAILSAEEYGRVAEVNFQSGTKVEQGQVLLSMDVAVEEASLKSAQARRELVELDAKRQRALRERNANSQADLDEAEAKLREANAEVDRLKALINRKKIIAPFAGNAGIRQVNVGQTLIVGTEVVSLYAYDQLFVDFSLPQKYISQLRLNLIVDVSYEGANGKSYQGKLTSIESIVDAETRNINVQATIDNHDLSLRPGMFVSVNLNLDQTQNFVTIPASSVRYAPYGDTVYVIETAGTEELRDIRPQIVTLGPQRGDQIAVLSGVKDGEEVVTSGVFKLRPGVKVLVNNSVTPGNDPTPNPADT